MNYVDNFENRLPHSTVRAAAWATLYDLNCINWKNTVMNSPKLRTYRCYKEVSYIEPYTPVLANRKLRSIIARFRCGVLQLEIETGRWRSIPEEERICKLCTSGLVESEIHFVFYCTLYETMRSHFFNCITANVQNFLWTIS